MDQRDVSILFDYLEQLVKATNRIADEMEKANSYQVCVDDERPLPDFGSIVNMSYVTKEDE